MGSLFGFFAGLGVISSAWSGDLAFWGIGLFIILTAIGILLFPMTVGTFTTAILLMSPIAIIAGLINGTSDSTIAALGIGICAGISAFVVGRLRPDVR